MQDFKRVGVVSCNPHSHHKLKINGRGGGRAAILWWAKLVTGKG